MNRPVLWQFTASHYNEKARWALDWKGVAHVRRSLLPGPHALKIRRMTGQTAVPVLVLDGRAIHDSTRIIEALEQAYPDPPLYPREPAERRRALDLEEFFDVELGPMCGDWRSTSCCHIPTRWSRCSARRAAPRHAPRGAGLFPCCARR